MLTFIKKIKNRSALWEVIAWGIVGFFAGRVMLFTLSLPEKYSMTLALGFIATPTIFLFRNKEKVLIGAFLFSLPVTMGFTLMERLESTSASVKLLFRLYLSDIFLILLASVLLFKVFLGRYSSVHSISQNRLIIPLFLWIGMGFVSLIPAIDRMAVAVEIVCMGRIFLTFIIVFHYIKGWREIRFILNCLLLALLFQALLMFAQYATNSLVISFPGHAMGLDVVEQGLRPSGTMGHSSHFAKFSGLILPIAFAYVFFASSLRDKLFMISIWLCGSLALVLTISRAGLATWLLSMIIFVAGVIILRIVPIRRTVPLFIMCILWIIISAGILYSVGGERLKSRIAYDAGSSAARIPMWEVAFNVIKAHPIAGVGLKNYTLVHQDYDHTYEHISVKAPDSPVHNLFLLYAAEVGIPGLLFFLWFIWELLRGALRCASHIDVPMEKAIYLSMAIGVISLFLQSTTGKGVTDHFIHLSVVAIFGACVAKQCLILNNYRAKSMDLSHTEQ